MSEITTAHILVTSLCDRDCKYCCNKQYDLNSMYDDQSGYIVDKTVFRGADDYCSKGEKRPCSYEKWWGIVDGYYPKEET